MEQPIEEFLLELPRTTNDSNEGVFDFLARHELDFNQFRVKLNNTYKCSDGTAYAATSGALENPVVLRSFESILVDTLTQVSNELYKNRAKYYYIPIKTDNSK